MIELKDISKTYPDGTRALGAANGNGGDAAEGSTGLDLSFSEGMLGLLGPNGAGKTTLLSILVMQQEPTTGSRTYFGLDDAAANRPRIRPMIGYLAQEFKPVATLSGFEYLEFCADMRQVPLSRKEIRARIWELLDAVELRDAAKRRADTYSGGMMRRLGLAQALIHAPRFLVVDEPTAGLDPEERIRFRNLVTDLAETIPVLLSTHIVEDIEATCPRLAVINHGRILFDGPPSDLVARYQGRLYLFPEDAPVPEKAEKVGQRAGADGLSWNIVCYDEVQSPPAGSQAIAPNLDDVAAAFLHVPAAELHAEAEEAESKAA
jgi:ABC-type multidrug transport system ATPase subunit